MENEIKIECAYTELVDIEKLIPHPKNSNSHPVEQVEDLKKAILFSGIRRPIVVSTLSGFIISGHCEYESLKQLGVKKVPVDYQNFKDDLHERIDMAAHNLLARQSKLVTVNLQDLAIELDQNNLSCALAGIPENKLEILATQPPEYFSENPDPFFGSVPQGQIQSASGEGKPEPRLLTDQFLVPPFTVLDQRQGYWQERKRQWLSLGIKSEIGRQATAFKAQKALCTILEQNAAERKAKEYNTKGWVDSKQGAGELTETGLMAGNGTSIFDPVLCELAYRWFCPENGTVVDPFAGGSVRGVVASKTQRNYIGIELRQEQVDANRIQSDVICESHQPVWHCGDGADVVSLCNGVQADFIFSCPPYADLEVYSDDPRDLSTMKYSDFRDAYRKIIAESVSLLKQDRFACFVVSEVRNKYSQGFYHNLFRDTIEAFESAGALFYNEAVLINSIGTLAIRVGRMFSASRKLGRTHQNVLVFCKGDPVKATKACGEIKIVDLIDPSEPESVGEKTEYGEKINFADIGKEV